MSGGSTNAWERLSKAVFEIGGEDQLAGLRKQFPTAPADDDGRDRLDAGWKDSLKHAGIRIGTLLKSDNISFLIGAGASKEAGGILLGSVPTEIEKQLLTKGINGQQVASWLKLFYEAIRRTAPEQIDKPVTDDWVRGRLVNFSSAQALKVNYEQVLACLFGWGGSLEG